MRKKFVSTPTFWVYRIGPADAEFIAHMLTEGVKS